MNIKCGRMTFDKLVKLLAMVDCELEPVLIILEDGKQVHKKVVQLSIEEIGQVLSTSQFGRNACSSTPIEANLPGLYGEVCGILIVSERYLNGEIESGVINLQKIVLEKKRREEALRSMPGFGGNWMANNA